MTIGINQLFEMLSWDSGEDAQQKGLEEAAKVKYLSIFIRPVEGKDLWENCAKVLASKTDEKLECYLMLVFEWLQDANWPGFEIIYKRIKRMSAQVVIPYYECAIKKAQQTKDEMWLNWMSGLISNRELLELLPCDQQKLMKKHYKNRWQLQEDR